ncbi:uncharacterized protein LOC110178285 isoform X2 [Drosophila serrata]|uniref:uncharacterized protein LOC110178285 isoform X2 n=1 Tax=Drosophila serrata TaxID=7274 RepID=UPI000A1D25CE|nr:uncharacterized protein LOC110178285 isoform X2 [Drosophila serrata]
MTDDSSKKHITYQESKESPQQDVVPQESPQQDVAPPELPLQAVVPQESLQQDVKPQEAPQQEVITQEASQQDVRPQQSLLNDVTFEELSLHDVAIEESLVQDSVPRESSQPDMKLQKSSVKDQRLAEKKRQVQAACLRLKQQELKEKKEREELLKAIQKDISQYETEKSDSSTIYTTSEATLKVNECDVQEEDEEKMMLEESESSSSVASPKELSDLDSEDFDDPMRKKVHDLMLVPSLSDFSVSEDRVVKPVMSMKSFASSMHLIRTETDSLESESESDSMESRTSNFEPERVGGSSELIAASPMSVDIQEIEFDEIQPVKKSIEFAEFPIDVFVRESSIVVEDPYIDETITIVNDFFNLLMRKVIADEDPNEVKRNKLDKNKLHKGISDCVAQYLEVAAMNKIFNDLMAEHYRLNKNIRVLAELSEEENMSYYKRYRIAMDSVGHAEERVAMAKALAHRVIVKAQLELTSGVHSALGTEHRFEQDVRHILVRPDSETDLLKRLIDRELRWMHRHRVEISYKRIYTSWIRWLIV